MVPRRSHVGQVGRHRLDLTHELVALLPIMLPKKTFYTLYSLDFGACVPESRVSGFRLSHSRYACRRQSPPRVGSYRTCPPAPPSATSAATGRSSCPGRRRGLGGGSSRGGAGESGSGTGQTSRGRCQHGRLWKKIGGLNFALLAAKVCRHS